ncbi:hypothetical protein EYF80_001425 [Liparis tanakae]|uniref:Uncharacterized protein n=1 Tax=Liparis tanakae TaxID=230148 RepID=A0A4Z2JDA4_9TELE|nr:hypothetical protein EYF80_001425 [Liparis tanakae]
MLTKESLRYKGSDMLHCIPLGGPELWLYFKNIPAEPQAAMGDRMARLEHLQQRGITQSVSRI